MKNPDPVNKLPSCSFLARRGLGCFSDYASRRKYAYLRLSLLWEKGSYLFISLFWSPSFSKSKHLLEFIAHLFRKCHPPPIPSPAVLLSEWPPYIRIHPAQKRILERRLREVWCQVVLVPERVFQIQFHASFRSLVSNNSRSDHLHAMVRSILYFSLTFCFIHSSASALSLKTIVSHLRPLT